jgi:DNA-binding CsgD family transcriptional regulator
MSVLHSGLARAARNRDAHAWGSAQVGGSGCIALLAAGRLAEARDLADQGYREAVGMAGVFGKDATPIVGAWAAIRGIVAKAQGRVGPALAALAEAAALLDNWPTFRMNRVYLAEQAGAHALGADTIAAADHLERADRLGDAPGVLFDAWVERDRAWVTAASGDRHTAAVQARHAADLARDSGQPTIEALALFDAARLGDPQVRGRLGALAHTLGGAIVPTLASVAAALHPERDGDPLDEASRRLAALGQYLYAAEAAAAAYRIHARTGRRSRGQAALTRALALARACEGARAPLLGLIGLHAVLTARELHIACMAAAGASSPKIAAQLGLSVRTVDNHLGRVYTKLGVAGRIQLADALADMPDAWSDGAQGVR